MSFHPSDISLREKHCGHAITLKNEGTKRDREVFQTGIAAHAVLEDIGKLIKEKPNASFQEIKQLANNTAAKLCTEGRAYDNIPEPPMKISQAIEGMKLALSYASENELEPEAEYELPLAFDKDWKRVPYYHPSAIFRTLIDYMLVYKEVDEDGVEATFAIVRDYKTSWHIQNTMLDSLQRRAQAVVVWLAYPEVDVLQMQIHGLRGKQKIERKIYTQYEYDTLEQWRDDISLAVKALMQPQIPNPGINCYMCPYAKQCQWTAKINDNNIVARYAAFLAIVKELEKDVRILTKESPATTAQGKVGYTQKERLTTQKNAILTLWELWKEQQGSVDTFLQSIKLSSTDAKRIAKTLSKNGLDYNTITDDVFQTQQYSQFGILKKKN